MAMGKWPLSGRNKVEKTVFGPNQPLDVAFHLDEIRLRSRPVTSDGAQRWITRVQGGRCCILTDLRNDNDRPANETKYCLHVETDPDSDDSNADVDREIYLPLSIFEAAASLNNLSQTFVKCYCAEISEYAGDDAADNETADEIHVVEEHDQQPQPPLSLNITLITYLDDKSVRNFYRARDRGTASKTGSQFLPTYRYLCEVMSRDPHFSSKATTYVMSRNTPAEIEQLLGFVCNYRRDIPTAEVGGGLIKPEDLVLDDFQLTLHQYQKRAVCWMVARERACSSESNSVLKQFPDPKFCSGITPCGDAVIYSFYDGSIEKDDDVRIGRGAFAQVQQPSIPIITDTIRGGILADEMGLGKTIEILTCIMNDPMLLARKKKKIEAVNSTNTADEIVPKVEAENAVDVKMDSRLSATDVGRRKRSLDQQNDAGKDDDDAVCRQSSSAKRLHTGQRSFFNETTADNNVAGASDALATAEAEDSTKIDAKVGDPSKWVRRSGRQYRETPKKVEVRRRRRTVTAGPKTTTSPRRTRAMTREAANAPTRTDSTTPGTRKKSRMVIAQEEDDEPETAAEEPKSPISGDRPAENDEQSIVIHRKPAVRARRQTRAEKQAADESEKNAALGSVGAMHADERHHRTLEVLSGTDGTGVSRMQAIKQLQEELLAPYSCAQYAAIAAEKKRRARARLECVNVECICGSDDPTGIVQCDTCRVWQHRACTGFYLDYDEKSSSGSVYHCPQCYQDCENIETHATLIVVPRALLQQWFDEISKCVKSSALSIFIYNGTIVTKKGSKTSSLARTKSIKDSHSHSNVTANVAMPEGKSNATRDAEPKHSHVVYTHPLVIAQHDIVITSYEILRDELQFVDLPDMRSKLRHPKRYNNACSPLTGIRFRRLVFDEAQLVEQSTSKLCAMAMRLRTQFVWAITGTPIIESFENLYGLFRLLGEKSLCDPLQFKMSLMVPYGMLHNARPLQTSLAHVMYRQTQQSVRDELNLPQLLRHVHMLELDPIERAFYAVRQTNVKNTVRSHAAGLQNEQTLGQLTADTHQQLLEDVNGLRMICLHPLLAGVTRGGRMVMPGIGQSAPNPASFTAFEHRPRRKRVVGPEKTKSVGLRASLLKLILLAKTDVLDEQRKVLMTLNALAGVSWCEADYKTAAEYYRAAVTEWKGLEPIGIEADRLQRIHTLANLHELLQLHNGDNSIGRTLNDDSLLAQVEVLKAEHIQKLTLALEYVNTKLAAARTSGHIHALTAKPDEAIFWVVDLIRSDLPKLRDGKNTLDLLVSGLTGCLMDRGFTRKFISALDAMGFFIDEWKTLCAARADAVKFIDKLQKAELLTSEFAQRAYNCHLTTRSTFARQVKAVVAATSGKETAVSSADAPVQAHEQCDICKCTMALSKYERLLYKNNTSRIRVNRKQDVIPSTARVGPRAQFSKTSAVAADWLDTTNDVESDLLGDAHKMVADSIYGRAPQAFETALTWLYTRGKTFYAEHFSKSSSNDSSANPFGDDGFGSRYAHLSTPQLTPKMFANVLGREFWLMRVVMRTVADRLSAFDEAGRQAPLRIQLKPEDSSSEPKKGSNKRKPTIREYQELHPKENKKDEEARLLIARSAIPTYQVKYADELAVARAAEQKKLSKYRFVVSLRQRMKQPVRNPGENAVVDRPAVGAENAAEHDAEDDDDPLARDILKDEKCPVCWEPLVKLPAYSFLPCAHFICDDDLEQLVRVNQGWLQCPQCREKCQPDSIVHVDNRYNVPAAKPTPLPEPPPDADAAEKNEKRPKVRFADENGSVSAGLTAAVDKALLCQPSTSAAAIAADKAASVAAANMPLHDGASRDEFDLDDENDDVQGDLSSKIAAIVKCLRLIKQRDPHAACLVFSGFPVAMKMLKTACQENAINAASVQTASEVSRMLDRLKGRQIDALILSYNACSRGLNITEANHILLLEPVLNKADELQAIGRAYRIGQTRNVHVHYFITKNTIEDRLHTALRDVETFSVPQSSIANLTVGMINSMVGFTANSPAVPSAPTSEAGDVVAETSAAATGRSARRSNRVVHFAIEHDPENSSDIDEAPHAMNAPRPRRRRTPAFPGSAHRLGFF